jgi:acetylornithine deacetylase/succinyl-diaminopimelate desuccinylase-like protein
MVRSYQGFDARVEASEASFIQQLREYLKTPCITGQGIGVRESAEVTAGLLRSIGAEVRLLESGGAPVVYGEIGSGPRTLLIYDHYDVQPPEPLELWESGPFDGDVRDGKVFARGVADNRGDALARMQAVATYVQEFGELPITIKFLIEGEEEIGSPNLPAVVRENRELLAADGCLWEAGGRDEEDRAQISLGLKGVLHLELRVAAAKVDLHSSLATIVPNAAWRLTWALASLKTPDDRIAVDGLMEYVAPPSGAQIAMMEGIPFPEEEMKADLGIAAFNQELSGLPLLKKHLFEPTCTIQGITTGYSGPGLKAVSPCLASAKVEFRLVPNLEPEIVLDLLRVHLDRRGFTDIEIESYAELKPALADPSSVVAQAAISAVTGIEVQPPVVYPLMAGSGPMSYFSDELGIPVVSCGGISWHDCRVHAPNESVRIVDYIRGIKMIGRFIDRFAEM